MSPRRPTGKPPGRPRTAPPKVKRPRGRPAGQAPIMAAPIYVRLSPEERHRVEIAAATGSLSAWVRRAVRAALGMPEERP